MVHYCLMGIPEKEQGHHSEVIEGRPGRYLPVLGIGIEDTRSQSQADDSPIGDFTEFYTKTRFYVNDEAYLRTGHTEDTKDILQESFRKAFAARYSFRGKADPKTWMFRIVRNQTTNFLSRPYHRYEDRVDFQDRNHPLTIEAEDRNLRAPSSIASDPVLHAEHKVELETVYSLCGQLPESMRVVALKCILEDTPHKDIARELGISETASKLRYHRAKERLRILWSDYKEAKAQNESAA